MAISRAVVKRVRKSAAVLHPIVLESAVTSQCSLGRLAISRISHVGDVKRRLQERRKRENEGDRMWARWRGQVVLRSPGVAGAEGEAFVTQRGEMRD